MSSAAKKTLWFIYLIRCRKGSLYTGIATDIERRFQEHQSQGPKTAKYLRGRAPLSLAFTAKAGDRSRALKLELAIKRLSKRRKEELISGELRLQDLLPLVDPTSKDAP